MYLPLIALAALGYFVYRASRSEQTLSTSSGGAAPLASPNIVLRGGVQYVREVDETEQKKAGQILDYYRVRPEPVELHMGPLAGSFAVVLDKAATADPNVIFSLLSALEKAQDKVALAEPAVVFSLDVLDGVLSGSPPDPITVIVAKPELAAEACKAPSAYAIWEHEESPKV